jgi:regulator of sigma E protease
VGIDVEAFSIGWGNPILKKKIGNVEYRLGMFPVGGYCKMRGENEFNEAWEQHKSGVEPVKGTLFGAHPLARILVFFAGPFFNLLFAILALSIIWGIGFEFQTLDNKIVLVSELYAGDTYPADEVGLKSGDRIIEINGRKINDFHDVLRNIATNPGKELPITVDRQGDIKNFRVTPELVKSTGAGMIGVTYWNDPVAADIVPGSDAAIAGLVPGDRIIRVNGENVINTVDVSKALAAQGPGIDSAIVEIDYMRDGVENHAKIIHSQSDEEGIGIVWPRLQYRTPNLSPPAALAKGLSESWNTFVVSLRSLGLLFKGIDLTQAVSGPIRITMMVGDVATAGFGQIFGTGRRSMADFLALISRALCIMNLLPLPILDGGLIILTIVEMIRRKPLHPRMIGAFQTVGVVLIIGLMIFAVFGDIQYLVRH